MGDNGLIGGGDSNDSNVARIGKNLDVMHFATDAMFGEDGKWNPHNLGTMMADKSNKWFSKVSKPINQLNTKITPGKAYIDENVPILKAWNETVENRPVDAVAIAAGAVFGGGALAGMGGGAAGAAGAPAASGGAGAAGGLGGMAGASSAITPAFASGAVGGGAAAGSGAAGMGAFGGALGGAGYAGGVGTLGTAGTGAATSMITPAFASQGGAAAGGNFLSNMSTQDKIDWARKLSDMLKPQDNGQSSSDSSMSPAGSYHNYHNY